MSMLLHSSGRNLTRGREPPHLAIIVSAKGLRTPQQIRQRQSQTVLQLAAVQALFPGHALPVLFSQGSPGAVPAPIAAITSLHALKGCSQ